jgi:Ca2+-binding RTX toxin-like protein
MQISVSSASTLTTALTFAMGGDTIALQAGDYTGLTLTGFHFDTPVTITSADASHPAVFSTLTLRDVQGLTFRDLEVKVDSGTGVAMSGGRNLVFDHIDVYGTAASPSGAGLLVRSSDGVSVVNSQFHNLAVGLSHLDSSHLDFSSNSFKTIRTDGIHGGGSSNVVIAGNSFTDFYRQTGDHPDAIQFWTTYATASAHDIVIKDNLIVRGDGTQAQGIFVSDQSNGKLPYVNLTITGNTVIGSMYHGIAVSYANGANISDNTVVGYQDMKAWILVKGTTDATVSGNVTSQLSLDTNTNLIKAGNTIVPLTTAATDDAYLNSYAAAHPALLAAVQAPLAAESITVITGDSAANDLYGTSGSDILDGRAGVDTMTGGAGSDFYGVDAKDKIVELADGGIDTVRSTASSYTLGANVENLTLAATGGQTGVGNSLDNLLRANGVKSILRGEAGDDTLVSTGGLDTFSGGTGHDTFRFEKMPVGTAIITDFVRGEDVLDLHPILGAYHGTDPVADHWVKFEADSTGLTVYVDPDGAAGPAAFTAVVKLTGVTLSDAGKNLLWNYSGGQAAPVEDTQTAPPAETTVVPPATPPAASTTDNTAAAPPATDVATAAPSPTTVDTSSQHPVAAQTGGNDWLGSAGNDAIRAVTGSNYLRGAEGDDTVDGGSGFDDINGNEGNDVVHGADGDDWAVGGKDNDQLFGDAGSDIVWGNLGNDTEDGGDGADQVRGGRGNDVLSGGAGDDYVSGDRGDDTVSGGAGADRFHGSQDAGIDRVLDFNAAEGDRVMLDPGVHYLVIQSGADTVIDMGGGNQMILENTQLSTLPTGWLFQGW